MRQRGFALLIVLWALALASLIVLELSTGSRTDVAVARNERATALGRAAADGAIQEAIFRMLTGRTVPVLARFDNLGEMQRSASVTIRDEGGRINPNVVGAPLLRALLTELGVDEQRAESLAAAMVDWRTPGISATPHGAKDAAYRAAGLNYGPPGEPVRSIAELIHVLGMTPAILAAMAPHLTLYWDGDPDVRLADPIVREAVFRLRANPGGEDASGPRVVTITAVSTGEAQVARHAVVRFGYSPDGRGWRVLAWGGGTG